MKIVRRKDDNTPDKDVESSQESTEQKSSVADLLRSLAADELISYHAYTSGARLLTGSAWMDVNQEFTAHAKEELEHYEAILTRLWQLGEPVPTVFKSIPDMASYYWDIEVESPEAAAKIALQSEKHAVEAYKKLLVFISNQSADEKDFATQKLAKSHLETEQEHFQDMQHLVDEF